MRPDLKTILKLKVPVIVQIGRRPISLDDVLALGPGAIVELNKPADATLELRVNNQAIGRGIAVKVGENFGIRIEEIGSSIDRIEAMGASGPAVPLAEAR